MFNGVSGVNFGDIIATIIILGLIAIPFILVIFIYKAYKKNMKRAEERLNVEKQQAFVLQKRVDELNERVIKIENLLKEID
ncbi:hypothetical protein [Lysinibacillus sphaericus]|uniref:Phage shock protein B n=1 Tax=Lysinibacillus sphaericus OT4b.31 TaxID=1285586 RepID=R7Z9I4_LYSSH|nr:hypothetical protein [Lysinibacillus sphaericus]EON70788.1 hypothetical protein H131_19467 [Lysinibacillus sphaericus OT4b.31]